MAPFVVALCLLLTLAPPARAGDPLPDVADRNRDGRIVIACLGDSNTASHWQYERHNGFTIDQGWCERLQVRLDDPRVETVNMGEGGATVSPHPVQGLYPNKYFEGSLQLEEVLKRHPVDLAILAFGTNDVLPTFNGIPIDIVDHYTRVRRQARAAGVPALVALTPLAVPHPERKEMTRSLVALIDTNRFLRERFAPYELVAFDLGAEAENFIDDVHMSAHAQALRARAAEEAVRRFAAGLPPAGGVRAVRWSAGHWGPKTVAPEARAERSVDEALD